MDWDKLKAIVEELSNSISKYERTNKALTVRIRELNDSKSSLENSMFQLTDKQNNLRKELIQSSKQLRDETSVIRLKKFQYILDNGSLEGFVEDDTEFKKRYQLTEEERLEFKELKELIDNLSDKISQFNAELVNVEARIKENKDAMSALNQRIAHECSEDIVEEITQTDNKTYTMVVSHRIYNPKSLLVIDNKTHYIKDERGWYLDRTINKRINKKINDIDRIRKLNILFEENKSF